MQFHRQRVLIEFLRQAGRPVGKIELMKWAFLLKAATPNRGGSAFYEFVPYKFGPYSFCLNREAEEMAGAGVLAVDEKYWILATGTGVSPPPAEVVADIKGLVQRFKNVQLEALLDHVYKSHKEYTVNSTREKLATRLEAAPAIHTVGYEGRQLDGLLDVLVQNGIRRLIDVRRNPVSRRFGFHKSTLFRHCSKLDIHYSHKPELGIPSEERSHLAESRDYAELFDRYERDTLTARFADVQDVADTMKQEPSAIMCMELEPCECHRSRLANRLQELTGLPIIHLR
jgi:hypothetical protein